MKYLAGIVSFLVVIVILAVVGWFAYWAMIISMNGFTESDASFGIWFYWIWAVLLSFLFAGISFVSILLLESKKEMNPFLAATITTPIALVLGVGAIVLGVVGGIIVADVVRTSF